MLPCSLVSRRPEVVESRDETLRYRQALMELPRALEALDRRANGDRLPDRASAGRSERLKQVLRP